VATLGSAALAAVAPPAAAQSARAYAFAAPGQIWCSDGCSNATLHLGAGAEWYATDAVSLGAEVGYLSALTGFRGGLAVLSVNGSLHVGGRGRSRPFVTGGVTRVAVDGPTLFNAGVGAHYWFSRRAALRLEVRDHVWLGDGGESAHLVGLRVGIVIRQAAPARVARADAGR
jgi:hypothetical protein